VDALRVYPAGPGQRRGVALRPEPLDGHGLPAVGAVFATVAGRALSLSGKAVVSAWQEHERRLPGVGEVDQDQSYRATTRSARLPRALLGVAGQKAAVPTVPM
jgi:hypothetical protein